MRGILLIGAEAGKRRSYFEQAAAQGGIPVTFLDWREILSWEGEGNLQSGREGQASTREGERSTEGREGQASTQEGERSTEGRKRAVSDWEKEQILKQQEEPASYQKVSILEEDLRRCVVKIDPPEWESSRLKDLKELTDRYGEWLRRLSRLPAGAFLNEPTDIVEVLNKRRCKERLVREGVPVTEMYGESFSCGEELFAFMRDHRIGQVFVKPVTGAGAAGVSALRFSPGKGRIALYTCGALERGEIVNTKRMYRLEGKEGAAFLDSLLKLDCVVERWYGKAVFREYCYDLRVIVQGGRIDFILPRLSKGPITNLHLNNHSMEFADLHLDKGTEERISEICFRAADCYPGLKSIGMDVLLEKGSLTPRIIEMNAQGDLLHRDVYGKNRIYGRQIEMIAEMLKNLPD